MNGFECKKLYTWPKNNATKLSTKLNGKALEFEYNLTAYTTATATNYVYESIDTIAGRSFCVRATERLSSAFATTTMSRTQARLTHSWFRTHSLVRMYDICVVCLFWFCLPCDTSNGSKRDVVVGMVTDFLRINMKSWRRGRVCVCVCALHS